LSVEILLAPARGGKTTYTVERIRALPALSPVRVLVPDQVEAMTFRRRLVKAGGALGVQVQTFYALYADALALADSSQDAVKPVGGLYLSRLPSSVRYQLIRYLVARLYDAGQLSYYAPVRGSPGFARLLADLLRELKRARIFPEALSSVLVSHEPRLAELARIYVVYQAWLLDTGWADAEGQGWLATIALEENPALLSDLALLVVDGFDEFNPTQLEVLRLLAARAAGTLVTLVGDRNRPDRLAHRRFTRARSALGEALGVEPAFLSGAGEKPDSLVHLEAGLFEPDFTPVPAGDAVAFLEAQNRATEVRAALRWLKARVVRDGVPLSDVAVVARDVVSYRSFLEETATEFGMPLRFVAGAPLRNNPAIAALLNLLVLSLETVDWSPRALIDALTSPYFDWLSCGLLPGDADRLDDVARDGRVVAGLDQWREALRRLIARAPQEGDGAVPELSPEFVDEDVLAPRRPPTGVEATRLEAAFEATVSRITPLHTAALRERVMWLEGLVGEDPALVSQSASHREDETSLRVVARARDNLAAAERDVAALRAFKDILRGLMLAESILGMGRDDIVSYDQFVVELIQAIDGATYKTPVEGDAVLVASAVEVRGLSFDSVALLGLAEGDFPRAEREDILLRESDRAWLADRGFAIEPRLQGDEATFFYQAVTRARRHLLLCRPYLADDGQPWEPSPYWLAALRLFDEESVSLDHIRPTDPVIDVASEQELVGAALSGGTEGVQVLSGPVSEAVRTGRAALAVLEARSCVEPSPWRGDLSTLAARLGERFGPTQAWSSSRLETYAKCPFYFWASYVMALEPREPPQAGFDVLILGSIYHLILERLYDQVPDGDPDRLRAELPRVARQAYDAAPEEYGFRPTPLWERQREEMTEVLGRTLEGLIDIAGGYKPTAPELAFGLRGRPPLVVRGEHPFQLRGYIDRVDRAADGQLRIIDYKAGSTPIAARDLTEGYRLQLPLYALAAQEALGAGVASGFYWHVTSASRSRLQLEKYQGGVDGAIEVALTYARGIVAAVRAGQFAPAPPATGCPDFCPAAMFCECFKPRAW
jgi:ATP-dependent helicase/nuclease subunit B